MIGRHTVKEYKGHYNRGWKASQGGGDGVTSPLERADMRGEPGPWYDGYMDYAADRPKWSHLEARRKGIDISELE
jgi:hypothetical protein